MKAIFEGLVFDERGRPATVTFVGQEPMYVVDDDGFKRHIPSEQVDRQILAVMMESIKGHEDMLTDQTAKMLGQEDPFSKAAIAAQWSKVDEQFENLLQTGIPEDMRAYLGMMGLKITINVHGEVIDVDQPGALPGDEGDE
jgi:hypothetical protein